MEWGEYKIEDLFDQERGKEAAPNRVADGTYNMINEISTNNGITKKAYSKNIIKGNAITISVNYAQNVFYQKNDFCASVNILVLRANWLTKDISLFVVPLLKRNNARYNYASKISRDRLNETKIQLPTKDGEIDFQFMENFIAELEAERIAELEAERIAELEAYLLATGLKDYNLTAEEKKVLADFEKGKFEWNEFEIGELFEINTYKKRFDANKVFISETGKPYIVRTALNNGVRGYIKEDEKFLNEGNTISFGQDTATMFYQEKPYFTGDKIKIIKSKSNKFNKLNAQFFISTMTKSFRSFTWGSSSFSVKIIGSQNISLPTQAHQPDYSAMETFISAIQKLVIKDVVLYADKKIKATKTAVNKKASA